MGREARSITGLHHYGGGSSSTLSKAVAAGAVNGPEAFVADMLQKIQEETLAESEMGGHKCKMALMSHHSSDHRWVGKEPSGLTRKDYTVQAVRQGLEQLGYPDVKVSEVVQRTQRGLNTVHHVTANVGWGPMHDASIVAADAPMNHQVAAASTQEHQGPSRRQRPSSAPAGGRRPPSGPAGGNENRSSTRIPADVLHMGLKLSEAERALSEVRAGLTSHMAQSGGGQSSSSRPHKASDARQFSSATAYAHVVQPGRLRPSSAPGTKYADLKKEAAANLELCNSSHIEFKPLQPPWRRKGQRLRPKSKPRRPTSAPVHSAARAAARSYGKHQGDAANGTRKLSSSSTGSLPGSTTRDKLTRMTRSQSWAFVAQSKPLPSTMPLSGGDCWNQKAIGRIRRQARSKGSNAKTASNSTGQQVKPLGNSTGLARASPPPSGQSTVSQLKSQQAKFS